MRECERWCDGGGGVGEGGECEGDSVEMELSH